MPVSWRRRLARRLRGWALALDPPQPRTFWWDVDGNITTSSAANVTTLKAPRA